jgi:predicted lipid-binding transport protein (Tim44 family)
MKSLWLKSLLVLVAIVGLMGLIIAEADARPGRSGGGGMGSRGSRTYAPPPVTNTAPTQARPIERSATQPGQVGQPSAINRPAAQQPVAGGFFNRPGLLGGLAAGFLGAGLLGLLMGNGLLGGLGGLASMFGLLLQVALIAGAIWLVMRWWRGRSQPTPAYAGAGRANYSATNEPERPVDLGRIGLGGGNAMRGGSALGGLASMRPAEPSDDIGIAPQDYDAFERLLGEIQDAYGREDINALRPMLTPEMLSYFTEELTENAGRGVINEIRSTKLLQGDLAEAWREGDSEYATVAMRYELVDRMVDRASGRASGRVIEGDETPAEVSELWTFRRARGGEWMLSAIQQA